jgi:mannitol-specific phosphotransferase system IIBC component
MLLLLTGLFVAEAVGKANNQRRGTYVAAAAAIGVICGMLLERGGMVFFGLAAFPLELRLRGAIMTIGALPLLSWVMILAVAAIAYYRLRA